MDDRVIQSTVDDSKPAATQGETFSVELGKFLPTTKTGDELQHDRFRKIRHSSKLITEALDAYHQGTTLAKSSKTAHIFTTSNANVVV